MPEISTRELYRRVTSQRSCEYLIGNRRTAECWLGNALLVDIHVLTKRLRIEHASFNAVTFKVHIKLSSGTKYRHPKIIIYAIEGMV